MRARRSLIQIGLLCAALLQALTSGAQPVTKISASSQSLFLKGGGSLWGMGDNLDGQLGDGTLNNTNLPEQIVSSNVTTISAGGMHSLFLKNDGSLWAMGYNYYGELGDGSSGINALIKNRPEQIVISNVTAIAAGGFFSLVLKNDGSLWAMGYNNHGQLGDGTTDNGTLQTNLPEQIVASNVTAIAAGAYHSLFLKNGGSLWAMGYNGYGQLGDGGISYQTLSPEQIVSSNITAIAGGVEHSLFLKNNGSLWAMGWNNYGQLGDGTSGFLVQTNVPEQIVASNVVAISAGSFHSLFLKSDGSLWAMGDNEFGQLGDGTTNNTSSPEQIVASNVTAIAAGGYYSLFLKNDGSLWAMGTNFFGQLGDGTYNSTNRPEQILGPYNQIQTTGQLVGGINMQLSFVGVANANYALDWSGSLSPANWIPQATNQAGSFGALVFTNAPVPATNNFWRIRAAP